MSTPQTDTAAEQYRFHESNPFNLAVVSIDFARKLENENSRLIERAVEWLGGCGHCAEIFFTGGANMDRKHSGCDAAKIIALEDERAQLRECLLFIEKHLANLTDWPGNASTVIASFKVRIKSVVTAEPKVCTYCAGGPDCDHE